MREASRRLRQIISVEPFRGDSFIRATDPAEAGRYHAVITNPPWELVKPDWREMRRMEDSVAHEYLGALRAFDRRLQGDYPDAQPARRFAGWGTNLARVGTDVALRLVSPGGICGLVSPSSLFADSNSEVLRARLFEELIVEEIAYFPAEARLFKSVDVPCVTFVARRGRSTEIAPVLTRFNPERCIQDRGRLRLSRPRLRELGYVIPVSLGPAGAEVLQGMAALPRFVDLEGRHHNALWAGRELDETRKERYLIDSGEHPFVKGVHVCRFGIARATEFCVDRTRVELPRSVGHPRLAWRDVSRPNQKRRVQATLIPAGWVTGNSLGVALFRDDNVLRLAALLALVSSIPFEYQLRSMLSTAHISLATVRRVHVPRLDDKMVEQLGTLAVAAMDGKASAEVEIEVEAARQYGLDKGSWESMLEAFPKLVESERAVLLGAWS